MNSILLCFLFVLLIAGNGFGQPEMSDTITSLPPVIVTSDNNLQSGTLSKIAIQLRGVNNSQEIRFRKYNLPQAPHY